MSKSRNNKYNIENSKYDDEEDESAQEDIQKALEELKKEFEELMSKEEKEKGEWGVYYENFTLQGVTYVLVPKVSS